MADSSEARSGIAVFLQKRMRKTLKSALFQVCPTLDFMFALSGDKEGIDNLGRPRSSVLIGTNTAKVRRESIMAEREYKWLTQLSDIGAGDAKVMSDYDANPSVSGWDSTQKTLDMFGEQRAKFCRIKMPYKVPDSEVRTAKGGSSTPEEAAASAIGSVYEAQVTTRRAKLVSYLNKLMWGTYTSGITGLSATGAPSDESAVTWDAIHSFAKHFSASDIVYGKDRSLASNILLRGNTVSAAKTLTFSELIDYCDFDLEHKKYGRSIQMIAVGATLWKKAKAEARAEHQIVNNGVPDLVMGAKRETVIIEQGGRRVYVYYDPECPASTALCIDPSTWTVAFAPGGNFTITGPYDQNEVEGGDEASTGNITVEMMMVNEDPKSGALFTSLS